MIGGIVLGPFSNFKMKHLPDLVLVVSGILFLGTFFAMLNEANLPTSTLGWVLATGGFFSFCIGWKKLITETLMKKQNGGQTFGKTTGLQLCF